MSNYDNGFARAQRAYDNQLPPDDEWDEEQNRKREAYENHLEDMADEERDRKLIESNNWRTQALEWGGLDKP